MDFRVIVLPVGVVVKALLPRALMSISQTAPDEWLASCSTQSFPCLQAARLNIELCILGIGKHVASFPDRISSRAVYL